MKQRVLVDLRIECEAPSHVGRWAKTLERRAKELDNWVSEFEEFMRDHRSQDPVSLNVVRDYQDQCSFCGYEWEVDEAGPVCCLAAQEEWNKNLEKEAIK